MSVKVAVLIFGAGINQLELIREARSLGLTSIVIDPQGNPPGKPEADFFYQVGGSDYELTREIAVRHQVSGIVTGQTEKPLRLMARLAAEQGFIFNSPEVTERCLDKWLMKEAFRARGVACAEGILVRQGEAIPSGLPPKILFPLIIKPRDAYSSRGVYKCSSRDDLNAHIAESRSFSSNGDVLLEEFIDGREYSVEAVTYQGVTTIIQFTEKFITPYPNTVETAHLQPAGLSIPEKESITSLVKSTLEALGIKNSASHTEVIMTKSRPGVIETGARLGGDFISSYLTKSSTGVSMDKAAIQIALGQQPDINVTFRKFSMIKYVELPAGKTVKEVMPCDDIRKLPGVVFLFVFVSPGDRTEPLKHSGLRPACVIVESDNKEDLLHKATEYSMLLFDKIILT